MIAEPYICYTGPEAGEITWVRDDEFKYASYPTISQPSAWKLYVDFEREKLRELGSHIFSCRFDEAPVSSGFRIVLAPDLRAHNSKDVCIYTAADHGRDSESSRLIRRAEFLKAVCEKEGVEWLPEETCWPDHNIRIDYRLHEKEELPHIPQIEPDNGWCKCSGDRDIRSKNGKCGNCGKLERPSEEVRKKMATGGLVTDEIPLRVDHANCIMRHQPIPVPERDYYTRSEVDDLLARVYSAMQKSHEEHTDLRRQRNNRR